MIKVRLSNDSDRDAIIALAETVFGRDTALVLDREWTWRWREDPRLPAIGYNGLVADSKGRIVGSTALQPAGLWIDGRYLGGWWQVNTMVHPDFRRRGIASLLNNQMPKDEVILGKDISAPMLVVLEKCGFQVVDTGGYWCKALNYAPRLSRLAGRFAGSILGGIANLTLKRLPAVSPKITPHNGDFDRQFNALWADVQKRYFAITCRDAQTLTWRYRRRPGINYTVLTFKEGDYLRGYAVCCTYRRRGCLRGRIVDLLTGVEDDEARRGLLAGAISTLQEIGVDRVDCFFTSNSLLSVFKDLGFSPSFGKDQMVIRGADPKGLYLTAGDGDGH